MIPSAPTTTGTTSAFNFHSFPNSILKYWYLSIFCCFFTMIFWSPGMAMSMIKQLFAILTMHTITDRPCSITLSIWIENPTRFCILHSPALEHVDTICQYILCETFCIVANGFSLLLYHAFFGIGSFTG